MPLSIYFENGRIPSDRDGMEMAFLFMPVCGIMKQKREGAAICQFGAR